MVWESWEQVQSQAQLGPPTPQTTLFGNREPSDQTDLRGAGVTGLQSPGTPPKLYKEQEGQVLCCHCLLMHVPGSGFRSQQWQGPDHRAGREPT